MAAIVTLLAAGMNMWPPAARAEGVPRENGESQDEGASTEDDEGP